MIIMLVAGLLQVHVLFAFLVPHTNAFLNPGAARRKVLKRDGSELAASPLTWSEISSKLEPAISTNPSGLIIDDPASVDRPNFSQSKPTFFKERHGWCPYSERVWIALEVKNVPYDIIHIDNSGFNRRPSYFSGQTPQITWPDGKTQGESMDLVREIDSRYESDGDAVELYPNDIKNEVINKIRAFDQIFPRRTRPSSRAAFLFRYDGEPLWKNEFEKVLRETNELLGDCDDGPFFCGERFTAADIAWAPFLERYSAQLPCLHQGLNPRSDETNYPNLVRWYNAMDDQIPCYSCRIKGDASSWRKVLTMAGFGNAGLPLDVSERMEEAKVYESKALAKEEAEKEQNLWDIYSKTRPWVARTPSLDVAMTMTKNRDAILKDIEKRAPASLTNDLSECTEEQLDEAMRIMICLLCQDEDEFNGDEIMPKYLDKYAKIVESLATYLDTRMCVPRDMGHISAAKIKRLIPVINEIIINVA